MPNIKSFLTDIDLNNNHIFNLLLGPSTGINSLEGSLSYDSGLLKYRDSNLTHIIASYEYVNDAIYIAATSGAVNITASNGLTFLNNDIKLGGTLSSNTVIDGNTFNSLTFDNLFNFTLNTNSSSIISDSGGLNITSDSIVFKKKTNAFPGVTYDLDYSNTYTVRSLVDKGYVTSAIGNIPVITASNGLNKSGNDIKLGGVMYADVYIDASLSGSNLQINVGNLNIVTNTTDINLNSNRAINIISGNGQGIEYALDYSNTYTVRSLVDKGYVTSAIGNIPALTASNGLTKISNDIKLGGALTANTIIDSGSSYNLYFQGNVASYQGVQYGADYSANFVSRSLVDKDYVDRYVKGIYANGTSGFALNSNLLNNQNGSYYLNRTNHNGVQTANTISDLNTATLSIIQSYQYKNSITGNGIITDFVITHNLNTYDAIVQIYRSTSPYDTILTIVERTNVNVVTIRFAVAPTDVYKVLIIAL